MDKVSIRRIRINQAGYDSSGTYYGAGGSPRYHAMNDDDINMIVAADDRDDAKAQVLYRYPAATFYR